MHAAELRLSAGSISSLEHVFRLENEASPSVWTGASIPKELYPKL